MFLECKDLTKVFSNTKFNHGVEAVRHINLAVKKNEFLCIIGPCGCGKTTLLHLLAGLEKPTEGSIHLEGEMIKGPSPRRAVVFQDSGLYPWKSVFENVEFGLQIQRLSRPKRHEIIFKYLDMLGLRDFENARPHQLSGGMKAKVAIARTLALDPDILLMDEPFGSLDEHTRRYLDFELLNIWEKDIKTVIFVTHSIEEAIILADRIILLSERPGSIQGRFCIDLPHPRNLFSPEVVKIRKALLSSFMRSYGTDQFKHLFVESRKKTKQKKHYQEVTEMGVEIDESFMEQETENWEIARFHNQD